MCCVKVDGTDWERIQASDRLLIEVPAWLAERNDTPDVLRGFVSWSTRKAILFVVEGLSWAGWLPKSQVRVLEVSR